MRTRLIGFALMTALLASCSSIEHNREVGLTPEQMQEIHEWEQQAKHSNNPIEGNWVELAPGVRSTTVVHADGGTTVRTHIKGLAALEWVAENQWQPRLQAAQEALANTAGANDADRERLSNEIEQLEARMAILERWRTLEANQKLEPSNLETASCTALAAASAMATSSSPGAKAYARARTCTSGYQGYARAAAEHPYQVAESWAAVGKEAYASEVAYSTDCSSAGFADGYPEVDDVWYHCPS